MDLTIPEADLVFEVHEDELRRLISEIYTQYSDTAIVVDLERPIRFNNGKILNGLAVSVESDDIAVLVNLDPVRVLMVPREKFIKTVREAIHRV